MEKQPEPVTRLSRRNLIIAAGGTAAAVGVFATSPFSNPLKSEVRGMLAGQSWARTMLPLASATFDEWQGLVGATLSLGGGSTIRLTGVRALASVGSRPYGVARRQAFLAVFDPGPGQSLAGDLIYTATHPQYGPLQLFLTSAPGPLNPARMHAVFN